MKKVAAAMKKVAAVLVIALSGCVSTGIQQIDDDGTYMYSKQDWMAYSGGGVKLEMLKEARAFCQKQGKKMVLSEQVTQDYAIGQSASAEIQFKCL